jgi:hypothetical protein
VCVQIGTKSKIMDWLQHNIVQGRALRWFLKLRVTKEFILSRYLFWLAFTIPGIGFYFRPSWIIYLSRPDHFPGRLPPDLRLLKLWATAESLFSDPAFLLETAYLRKNG